MASHFPRLREREEASPLRKPGRGERQLEPRNYLSARRHRSLVQRGGPGGAQGRCALGVAGRHEGGPAAGVPGSGE